MYQVDRALLLNEDQEVEMDYLLSQGVKRSELERFVEQMGAHLNELRRRFDIEEGPPSLSVDRRVFDPGGWVGAYYLGEESRRIVVRPHKIDPEEFETIRRDITGWFELMGAPFVEGFFQIYSSELLDRLTLSSIYSRFLILVTESLVGSRPPRRMTSERYVGTELRGRPDWKGTVSLRGKDPTFMVSRRIEFVYRTTLNLLFTRFHADLASNLSQAPKDSVIQPLAREIDIKRAYHTDFLYSEPYRSLFEEALMFDPYDPLVSQKLSSEVALHKGMQSVVDLWEAYSARKSTWLKLEDRFDAALKPMSKVYELWVLRTLVSALNDICGDGSISPPTHFPCTFSFGGNGRVKLYYNGGPSGDIFRFSQVVEHMHRGSLAPGPWLRPDFAITVTKSREERIVVLGDAKYRELDSIQKDQDAWARILTYVFDYTPEAHWLGGKTLPFLLFHLGPDETFITSISPRMTMHAIPLRPRTYEKCRDHLIQLLRESL